MKTSATLLIMLALALVGCRSHERAEVSQEKVKATLESSLGTMENLSRTPSNAVPDAVLNRTRCIVIVPQVAGVVDGAVGVASCREQPDRWTKPSVVTFSGEVKQPVRVGNRDLLVLVVTDAAVQRFRRGELSITGQTTVPGMTVNQDPNNHGDELKQDTVVYLREGGTLSGVQASGKVAMDAATRMLTPEKKASGLDVNDALAGSTRTFLNVLTSYFNTITPTGIIIHHSGVIPATEQPPASPQEVDRFHAQRGFLTICFGREYHVAYHYLILANGTVQPGRPEQCQGAHALTYNSYLGIALVGDFSSKDNPRGEKGPNTPTPQQLNSLVVLCRRLRAKYHIPVQRILRHSDVSRTDCPGDRLPFAKVVAEASR